jgi:hypothetical protein
MKKNAINLLGVIVVVEFHLTQWKNVKRNVTANDMRNLNLK